MKSHPRKPGRAGTFGPWSCRPRPRRGQTFAAGIIAAGEGSRLRAAFPDAVKPLVPVAGSPLCRLVAGALIEAGATSLAVIVNSRGVAVRESLQTAFPRVPWRFFVEDTASSWESFRLVASSLSDRPDFLMSTADALVPPPALARFLREMRRRRAACGMGLTDFIDDEKPLWAEPGPDGALRALGPACRARTLATCGVYYMTGAKAAALPPAAAFASLRRYWTAEVAAGRVDSLSLGKTVDVDRPEDVITAERFLKESPMKRQPSPLDARLPRGGRLTA
ncbi:MAG: NTP transferase domain-containing protein [Elusimicrobia bacterium]|nr:NTP transferase domain-containing protein [Elusimicrobiota bacterium]